MGGQTSGNYDRRPRRKTTVEESLCLTIGGFRGRLVPGGSGIVTWSLSQDSIEWFLDWRKDPVLVLKYVLAGEHPVQIPVPLQTTPGQFGGCRWWFLCPMVEEGRRCNRRSANLYLPPGGGWFACRRCHDLAYQSCQRAHRFDRRLNQIFRAYRSTGLVPIDHLM